MTITLNCINGIILVGSDFKLNSNMLKGATNSLSWSIKLLKQYDGMRPQTNNPTPRMRHISVLTLKNSMINIWFSLFKDTHLKH